MNRKLLVLLITLIILPPFIGCQAPPTPHDQATFMAQFSPIKRNYENAKNNHNDIQVKSIKNHARAVFERMKGQHVIGWVAKVEEVNSGLLGNTWVATKNGRIKFKLWPDGKFLEGNKPLEIFSILKKGDWVSFDGIIRGEISLTISGAIKEPEIKIHPTHVEKIVFEQ